MKKKRKSRKLNNKGFAISSVLYSLLIMVFLIVVLMMGMMASNRKNTHKLVDQIEEELNRYSLSTTTFEFDTEATTVVPQEFVVPTGQAGWYKIELWGASGGSTVSETGKKRTGGKGSYVSGIVYLEENETIYFYIGGTTTTYKGGLNGGGDGGTATGKGGGGSTDVRTVKGSWNEKDSLESRFMVAAGGGGADGLGIGSSGGSGGLIWGNVGSTNETNPNNPEKDTTKPYYIKASYGKQIGPTIWNFLNQGSSTNVKNCNRGYYVYYKKTSDGKYVIDTTEDYSELTGCGRMGEGGTSPSSRTSGGGGGSGYFGGGAGTSNKEDIAGSGGGGSCFIAGYGGVKVKGPDATDDSREATYYTGDKNVIEGKMAGTINEGNGFAKIELVSQADKNGKPQKRNNKLDNVRYIRDCTSGTVENPTQAGWAEIQAELNGVNLAAGKITTISGTSTKVIRGTPSSITDGDVDTDNSAYVVEKAEGNEMCATVDLGTPQNLDEIFILHPWNYKTPQYSMQYNHKIETSSDGSNWKTVKKYGSTPESKISSPERTNGYHYTSWNIDNELTELPNGIYYIQSTMDTNGRSLTAINNNQATTDETGTSGRHVSLTQYKSNGVQKWAITKLSDGYYKIVEIESNNALQIKDSNGAQGTAVNTASAYNDTYDWTKWKIIPLGDGTYRIQAKVGSRYLATIKNSFYTDSDIQISDKKDNANNTFTQRWTFSYALY